MLSKLLEGRKTFIGIAITLLGVLGAAVKANKEVNKEAAQEVET